MKPKPTFGTTAQQRRRSLLYWQQLSEDDRMKSKQTPSPDRQAFPDKINAVCTQARDLKQQFNLESV